MATTNPVYQVLVTTGDQAILAINNKVENLAVGQLGLFNFHTGLSISAASPVGDMQDIFIAVGLNKTGAGGGATLEDINRSSGQMMQVRHTKSITMQGYLDQLPKIIDIDGIGVPRCETDYAIKVEFRNSKVYALNGYNQFAKTYNFRTGACADQCTNCGTADCATLIAGLGAIINADTDALITATYYGMKILVTVTAGAGASASIIVTVGTTAYTVPVINGDTVTQVAGKIVAQINSQAGSPYRASNVAGAITIYATKVVTGSTDTFTLTSAAGTGVTVGTIVAAAKQAITDTAAFITAYPGSCLLLRLTSNPLTVGSFSAGVNPMYNKMRVTNIIVSLIAQDQAGFTGSGGTITTIQEMREEQGEGYDIQELEYVAGGWNGKPGPYRVSETTGIARNGFEYYAVKGAKYTLVSITYDQMSVGGWLEYLNNLETVIAIPCASTTTLTGLAAVLTAVYASRFPSLVADAAAIDCTNVEIHTINDVTADGVDSIG